MQEHFPEIVYTFGDFGNKCGIKETNAGTLARDCLRIWRFWEQTRDKNKQNKRSHFNSLSLKRQVIAMLANRSKKIEARRNCTARIH